MDYYKLEELENQYPDVANYKKVNDRATSLSGVYPKNKIEFKMPDTQYIKPVENTSFRFILAIKNGNEAERYYTSKPYFDDLKSSYDTNNPYFYNTSLYKEFTVKIDISNIMKIANTLAEKELKDAAQVSENIFYKQTALYQSNEAEQKSARTEYETLVEEKRKTEAQLDELKKPKVGPFVTKKEAEALKLFRSNKQQLETRLKTINSLINTAQSKITTNSTITVSGVNPKLEIDYIKLIQFFDYCLTKDDFSPDSAETGGVKKASELGVWKVKKYIPAQESTRDSSSSADKDEAGSQQKQGTFVGNLIRKVEKIPVIGQIVSGVKAVVNVVGKAVKAVGNFFKKIFSDKRVKENLTKVATIGDINIYKFNYVWDKDNEQYGVIAQELLGTKYESAVFVDEESGLYKVDYEKLNEMVDIQSFINQLQQTD